MFDQLHLKGLDYGWMGVMCICICFIDVYFHFIDLYLYPYKMRYSNVWPVAFERGLTMVGWDWWFMASIRPSSQFSRDSANIVLFHCIVTLPVQCSMQEWNRKKPLVAKPKRTLELRAPNDSFGTHSAMQYNIIVVLLYVYRQQNCNTDKTHVLCGWLTTRQWYLKLL